MRTYSHGMRQRLALAQALLPMPKVLLLDEPTDGLDPEGIHEFRATVLKLREEHGLTILLNSHLLSEVEQMCDRCVILREGSKVYEGTLKRTEHEQPRYLLAVTETSSWPERTVDSTGHRLAEDGTVQLMNGTSGSRPAREARRRRRARGGVGAAAQDPGGRLSRADRRRPKSLNPAATHETLLHSMSARNSAR